MPGVKKYKEYHKEKKGTPKASVKPDKKQKTKQDTGVVSKEAAPESFVLSKEAILQDPDLKSFKDEITVNGRKVKRECREGIMRTRDRDLMKFQMSKGFILINNEEFENGKEQD